MINVIKVKEMTFFRTVPFSTLLSKLGNNEISSIYANFSAIGPEKSGFFIYNLNDVNYAYMSMVFLDRKIEARKFVNAKIKIKEYLQKIPICEVISYKSVSIDLPTIVSDVKKILREELHGKIDLSDIIVYSKESVTDTNFDLRELTMSLTITDSLIDYTGKKLLIIGKSLPLESEYKIVFRNIYLIVIYSLQRRKVDYIVITIHGHVEE